ncbi:protein conserved in bacteria [Beggiatoa sp. PS]|nr:protein conserved in bacteria [Beggiatoa sp. PS]
MEAKVIEKKGFAKAKVLKAKYEALIPEIYLAELKKDIAQIMYPNLKGITVTMPHNIVNLGDKNDTLQTNLDVLSSFATIGVMDGLEKRAKKAQKMDEYK